MEHGLLSILQYKQYSVGIHLTNTHRNKRGARPFLCLTKIPSRQDPMSMSAPWLSCVVVNAKMLENSSE